MHAHPHGTIPPHSHDAKLEYLGREIKVHLPFTVFFAILGMLVAAMFTQVNRAAGTSHESVESASKMLFHVFHPIHLLFSAIATTAMFWRYDRHLVQAVVVGFIGSVGVCGLSDVFMPYLAGSLLPIEHMHFHWCLIQHPMLVLPFVAIGIAGGIVSADTVSRSTVYSHSSHVAASSFASLFYLISYGVGNWMSETLLPCVFVILVLCVMFPCCFSDVIFPLLLISPAGHEDENGDGHPPEDANP